MGRDALEEGLQLGPRDGRAGRVVGAADDDHLGAAGDRVGHRVEVVPRVPVTVSQRHLHRRRAGDGDRDRVGLEGPPGVDDLVAALAERLQQVVEHGHRARAGGEPLDGYVETGSQRGVQLGAAHVGVAVHPAGRLDGRLEDTGQRGVRVLVRGQLVGGDALPGGGWLPGDVGGDVADRGSDLGTHAVNIRPPPGPCPRGRSASRPAPPMRRHKRNYSDDSPPGPRSRTLGGSVVPGGELPARSLPTRRLRGFWYPGGQGRGYTLWGGPRTSSRGAGPAPKPVRRYRLRPGRPRPRRSRARHDRGRRRAGWSGSAPSRRPCAAR